MAKKNTNGNAGLATISAQPEIGGSSQPVEKTNLDTCMKVLAGIQEQVRFADTKAAFVLGINTLMFGFLAVSIGTLRKNLALTTVPPAAWVGLVFLILFAICAVLAVGTLLWAVMSRFGKLAPKSRCFFGHIATDFGKDYGKYVTEMKAMTEDDWITEVGTQIVETSHIALSKHSAVKVAAIISIVGLASWVVALVSTSLLSCP
jgi:hypothetical protein